MNRDSYTSDEHEALRDLIDELPSLFYGCDGLEFEDTIFKLNKIVEAATKRRAKVKADELLSLNQWIVDLRKINS